MLPLALALALATAAACGGEARTPEERVRRALAAAERAAEERDAAAAKRFVSAAYADRHGRTKRDIDGIIALHVLRHRSAHLLTRIARIDFAAEGAARVIAWVAMTGRPVGGVEELAGLRADLVRFELELRDEDGEWKVVDADWRRASLGEFGDAATP